MYGRKKFRAHKIPPPSISRAHSFFTQDHHVLLPCFFHWVDGIDVRWQWDQYWSGATAASTVRYFVWTDRYLFRMKDQVSVCARVNCVPVAMNQQCSRVTQMTINV